MRYATVLLVVCSALVRAQSSAPEVRLEPTDSEQREIRIEGTVLNDANSQPLRRARVILEPLEAGLTAIAVEADDRGDFTFRKVPPGSYRLSARRDGFLDANIATRGTLRMPPAFTLSSGNYLRGVIFRMKPWGVMTGRVRYDDGEPAIGARIDLYRQLHDRGKTEFRAVASSTTDDLGEYRIHGLPPAQYYLAASPPPTAEANVTQQIATDDQGRELPVSGYAPTFYPDTLKIGEAVAIKLDAGREMGGLDVFLQRTRKVTLAGRVTEGLHGTGIYANLYLARVDADNQGSLTLPVRAQFDRDSNFTIRNVPPGVYDMWAEASVENKRLMGRKTITVSTEDIGGLELLVAPDRSWSAEVKVEGGGTLPENFAPRLRLEPRSERGMVIEVPLEPGLTPVSLAADETYDVYVNGLPEDLYLSAVRVAGTNIRDNGLSGAAASQAPFQIVLDSRGGRIAGRAFDPRGDVMSGANLVLIPDPATARLQDYREAAADEYGIFAIRGIAPGRYVLVAWLDDPPCEIYDPAAISTCRAVGKTLDIQQSSEQTFALSMAAPPR